MDRTGIARRLRQARPDLPTAPAQRSTRVRRIVDLQRTAGNRAVTRLLSVQRAPDPQATNTKPAPRVDYVFIVGDTTNDLFYKNAKGYFAQELKSASIITDKRTLSDILDHVNKAAKPVGKLIIVTHANDSGQLQISLDAADLRHDMDKENRPRLEYTELKRGAAGALPAADVKLIDDKTQVEIRGCDIGRSQLTLDELDKAFGGKTQVTAPTHAQSYAQRGGKFEETLSDYYLEAPGKAKKSAGELKSEFAAKYPFVPPKQWPGLLKKVKVEPTKVQMGGWNGKLPPADDAKAVIKVLDAASKFPTRDGWVHTYKGRTSSGGIYTYTLLAERVTRKGSEWQELIFTAPIPPAEADLITNAKAESGRPEGYAWTVARKVTGTDLELTVWMENTEWVIHGEVSDKSGPIHPPDTDTTFYGKSRFTPPTAP